MPDGPHGSVLGYFDGGGATTRGIWQAPVMPGDAVGQDFADGAEGLCRVLGPRRGMVDPARGFQVRLESVLRQQIGLKLARILPQVVPASSEGGPVLRSKAGAKGGGAGRHGVEMVCERLPVVDRAIRERVGRRVPA